MNYWKLVGTALLISGAGPLYAQTTSYAPFPANQTIMSTQWKQIPGCACGINKSNIESFRKTVTVSPTAVSTPAGQPVQIRYDASVICNGQGVHDVNGVDISQSSFAGVGTVTWQAGTIQTLPNAYGIVTFSGYNQPKSESIIFKLDVQCYDIGAKCTDPNHQRLCNVDRVVIPVTVTAKKAAPAKPKS